MIQLENVDVYIDKIPLLKSINLQVEKGSLVGLIGPNGAGKSTLMKVLARLMMPASGECRLFDKDLATIKPSELAKRLSYLPQSSVISWPLTVEQVVQLGRLPYQRSFSKPSKKDVELIDNALKITEIEQLKTRIAYTLSGGELARVMLARVLATEPELILADEPIASLDPYHQLHVLEILRQHANTGCTVMISLHDLNYALRFCDYMILLESGKIVAQGTPEEVISLSNIENVYQIRMKWLEQDGDKMMFPVSRIN